MRRLGDDESVETYALFKNMASVYTTQRKGIKTKRRTYDANRRHTGASATRATATWLVTHGFVGYARQTDPHSCLSLLLIIDKRKTCNIFRTSSPEHPEHVLMASRRAAKVGPWLSPAPAHRSSAHNRRAEAWQRGACTTVVHANSTGRCSADWAGVHCDATGHTRRAGSFLSLIPDAWTPRCSVSADGWTSSGGATRREDSPVWGGTSWLAIFMAFVFVRVVA